MDPLPSWGSIGNAIFPRVGPGLLPIAETDRRSQILLFPPSPARKEKSGSSWYAHSGERGSPFPLGITGHTRKQRNLVIGSQSHTTIGPPTKKGDVRPGVPFSRDDTQAASASPRTDTVAGEP